MSQFPSRSNPSSVGTVTQQVTKRSQILSCDFGPYIDIKNAESNGSSLTAFYAPQVSQLEKKPPILTPTNFLDHSMTVYPAKSLPDVTISYSLDGGSHNDIRPVGSPSPETTPTPAWIVTKSDQDGGNTVNGAWIQRPCVPENDNKWTLIGGEYQALPPIFGQSVDDSGSVADLMVFVRDDRLDVTSRLPPNHTHIDHCSEFVYATKPLKGYQVSSNWTPHLSQLRNPPPTT